MAAAAGYLSIVLVCLCLSACVERASEWTNNFDSLHSPSSRVLGQNLQQPLLFQKTLFWCCSSASHFSSSFTHSHFHSLFLFFPQTSSFLRFSESYLVFTRTGTAGQSCYLAAAYVIACAHITTSKDRRMEAELLVRKEEEEEEEEGTLSEGGSTPIVRKHCCCCCCFQPTSSWQSETFKSDGNIDLSKAKKHVKKRIAKRKRKVWRCWRKGRGRGTGRNYRLPSPKGRYILKWKRPNTPPASLSIPFSFFFFLSSILCLLLLYFTSWDRFQRNGKITFAPLQLAVHQNRKEKWQRKIEMQWESDSFAE